MSTDEDKESAGIRSEGEAQRRAIRRPRLDRDGLFLFGRRHAAQTATLGDDEIEALRQGETIAVDIQGEYILYLRLGDDAEASASKVDVHARPATAECGTRIGNNIARREDPDRRPTDRARAVAARVRVNADRRVGRRTPQWIVDLARMPE